MAARERGIAIPDDLSVVGFDDLDFARVLAPPLTTVASTPKASARPRSTRWRARLAGETVEREQVMPVRLEVRESTALPRLRGSTKRVSGKRAATGAIAILRSTPTVITLS